jgi:hypothetical protein
MGRALVDVANFPMLSVCSEPGCRTVVFGSGTCVEHDAVPIVDRRVLVRQRTPGITTPPLPDDVPAGIAAR